MTVVKAITVVTGLPQRVFTCANWGVPPPTMHTPLLLSPRLERDLCPLLRTGSHQPKCTSIIPKSRQLSPAPSVSQFAHKVLFGSQETTSFPPVYRTLQVVLAGQGAQTPRVFPLLPIARF